MSVRRRSGFLALVLTGWVTSAWAQGEATPPIDHERLAAAGAPLTLNAALDEALQHNPTLLALRAQLATERQKRAGEGFLTPPTLEAEIWQWPVTSVSPLDTNMYMFTMRQEIPGRGKRAAQRAAADLVVDVAANDIAVRARDVIAQVTRAYAELAISREATAVHRAHVDLLRQTAELTTTRYGAGRGNQQDALKAVAEISRLHGDLITLEERARVAAAELNALLDRDPGTPVGAVALPSSAPSLPALDGLQAQAIAQHPELKGAQLEIARAEAGVAIATSNYRPDFMVMGGYQLMPRMSGAWTASVGVTWPGAPWSRGALDANRAQALAAVDVARAKQVEAVNGIRLAVQQAYIHASAAAERARLYETTVIPQLEQVLEASRLAYAAERGDATSIVESQRMVLDAQLAYYQALSDADVARADLERAIGASLPVVARLEER
jgi:outer membrane protein, heavy metal efflux system